MFPFNQVTCSECGLVYLDPRPSPEELGQYYSTNYYTSQAAQLIKPTFHQFFKKLAYQARCESSYGITPLNRTTKRVVATLLGWHAFRPVPVCNQGILLDVGCGNGEYAAWIRDNIKGWKVEGVEVNEYAATQAREAFGLRVYIGHLPNLHLPESHYDMISFWHSLEHMYSPSSGIRESHRLLRNNGVLAIEVPNVSCWEAKFIGANWYHLSVPLHLYHFTPTTLSKMIQSNGFRIISMKQVHGNASILDAVNTNKIALPSFLKPLVKIAAHTLGRQSAWALRVYAIKTYP